MQSTAPMPSAGTKLGDFVLQEPLAKGGFGAVFRAKQTRLDRDVAIKVLLSDVVAANPDMKSRFLREIDLVSRLEHPNIVVLHDFGADDGVLWMAMELVRGDTLKQRLHRGGAMSPSAAKRVILQVLSALVTAHDKNIVHRDLKPSNIMLTEVGADQDFVKLLDFGIGKAVGATGPIHDLTKTEDGVGFGTPRYMAPEQMLNEDIGAHTDVYAIALILYEMLVGRPAVDGDSQMEILARQVSQPIELPTSLVGTPMGEVIATASAKQWGDRFANAREFYRALEGVGADDTPIEIADAEGVAHADPTVLDTPVPSNRTPSSPIRATGSSRVVRRRKTPPWLWVVVALAAGVVLMMAAIPVVVYFALDSPAAGPPDHSTKATAERAERPDALERPETPIAASDDAGSADVSSQLAFVDTPSEEGAPDDSPPSPAAEPDQPTEVAATAKEEDYCSVTVRTGQVKARVVVEGQRKCRSTPCSFKLPRRRKVLRGRVDAAGYYPRPIQVDVSRARTVVNAVLVRKI